MAINKISDFGVGDVNFTAMMETLNKAYKGKADVTISEYDTDAAPDVKVGSVFDCNGTLYAVITSDETPTGYSGISSSTAFYLYFDESAEAFIYSSTAPTWSDAFQGWYNGNDRALFSMYKDSGGTLYQNKTLIQQESFQKTVKADYIEEKTSGNGVEIDGVVMKDGGINTDNASLKMKTFTGSMSTSSTTISFTHGLTYSNIRGVSYAGWESGGTQLYLEDVAVTSTAITIRKDGVSPPSAGNTVVATVFYI